jgi:S-DNA-T family DNA segregation ATPase FtsK/SpoIIIE
MDVPDGGLTIGSADGCALPSGFVFPDAMRLAISAEETGLHAVSSMPFGVEDGRASNRMLAAWDVIFIDEKLSMAVYEKRNDEEVSVSLDGESEITIGRSGENDIRLLGPHVSSRHAVLRAAEGGWTLLDNNSGNGTFVGRKRVMKSARMTDGAEIFIGGWRMIFRARSLSFKNMAGPTEFSPNLQIVAARKSSSQDVQYPVFQRSPRLKPVSESVEVDILPPPSAGARPSVSWLSVLLPPSMMILVMITVAYFIRSAMTLYYIVPMSCVSIIIAIVNYRVGTKKWGGAKALAAEKYARYIAEKEAAITAAETHFIKTADAVNPSVYACFAIASRRERRLWERSPSDEDFLEIRIGRGAVPSNVKIKIPQNQLSLEEDPLLKDAEKLNERHKVLSGVPVTHSFMRSTINGLAGTRDEIRRMAYIIIAGIAAHHSYEDVKIACVFPESERNAWDWIRWLPHVWDAKRAKRFIACTEEDASMLLRELAETLKSRARSFEDERRGKPKSPFYFLLLADKELTDKSGEQFFPESPNLGMTVLYAYGDLKLLPSECETVISCSGDGGSLRIKTGGAGPVPFVGERAPRELMNEFAVKLAPVRLISTAAAVSMPYSVTFLQGIGAIRAEDLDVAGLWARSKPYESIAAPIGIKENGDVFYFDIHESGMGPHGIVAGTTRWGKSETLTTWILSMALHFHPQEVSFALIDFKGDGLSGILTDLPHVSGVISNIDDMSSIERNLRSLNGELVRRQRVFRETKLENIHKYQEARRKNSALEPMPYLIVVIDEFAELKTQFPDQMNEFISIARVGGSLGVYLTLATQSPGGGLVAGQISANSRFRICLKTVEASESREIIGNTDAFRITTKGRAYVKVGNNEIYEQIQTFYSKAPYHPELRQRGPSSAINIVKLNGSRARPEVYDKSQRTSRLDQSEGRAVASHIKNTAAAKGVSARSVWTEALPKEIFLSSLITGREAFHDGVWNARNDGLAIVAGITDDPDNQVQYPLELDFIQDGHHIIYGAPTSGKTVFLQTVIISAALTYTPEQVQFLILDFGSWGLKTFENLPHTLLVADPNDAENVKRAGEYMVSELASRKRRFAEQGGPGTLKAYMEVTGESIPYVIVVIDNVTALLDTFQDMTTPLIEIAREGSGLGLFLAIAAVNQSGQIYRINQHIKAAYALQLTDKSEYRGLVGGSGRLEPGHFKGRGLTKGTLEEPLEFQIALGVAGTGDSERIKNRSALCDAMKKAWRGPVASIDGFGADALECDGDRAQIGIDRETGKPFDFVFGEMNGCVVSGTPGSGKTNVLAWIVRGISKDADTNVYVYEKGSALESLCGRAKTARGGAAFDAFADEIADEYDRRADTDADSPRIVICVDDFAEFFNEISDASALKLRAVAGYGEKYGIYVYISGEIDKLLHYYDAGEELLKRCLDNGNGVALGGRLKDHRMFERFYEGEDIVFSEDEGCVIRAGRARRVKFALTAGEQADAG